MQERKFTVHNKAGIHCRPSGVILNTIKNEFPDHCFEIVTSDGHTTEISSMLALISLGLTKGTSGILKVEGCDEERAVQKIAGLLEFEFDFPPLKS